MFVGLYVRLLSSGNCVTDYWEIAAHSAYSAYDMFS